MATNTNANWGAKGTSFGKVILYFILFIIMMVWIYNMNGLGL